MTAAPSVFSYEWEPVSTKVAGVDIEVNLFNIAPCAVVVDASGVKVHLWNSYLLIESRIKPRDPVSHVAMTEALTETFKTY
jgi:hypothetical protein